MNKDICIIAQNYAEKLAKSKALNKSGNKYKGDVLGENILYSDKIVNGKMVSSYWYNEISKYDFEKDYQKEALNFSQMVWKDTKEVGFGLAGQEGNWFIVANYYPCGNLLNQYSYNVLRKDMK